MEELVHVAPIAPNAITKRIRRYATAFDPAYCDRAVDFLGKGHSINALASELKCQRKTIYKWMQEYPEFADAIDQGESVRTKALELALMRMGLTGEGNAAVLIFLAKNWAGMRDDYRHEVSGVPGSPIQIEWQK